MTVEDPRQMRIAGQSGAQGAPDRWQAASYRCACGHAAEDADEFGRHLDAADVAEPEHFEVLDGWALWQVRQWQASVITSQEARPAARAVKAP
jgi:hypothetical protein